MIKRNDDDIEQISPTGFIKRSRGYFEAMDETIKTIQFRNVRKAVLYFYLFWGVLLSAILTLILIIRLAFAV
jgi:hypothetical protein